MLNQLVVFTGEATAMRAIVYARVPGLRTEEGWRLGGFARGPESRFAKTLPARYALHDCGHGADVLVKATVADPCFWSLENPAVYSVRVELCRGDRLVEQTERTIAFHCAGLRDRRFWLGGQPWLLRGAWSPPGSGPSLAEARQHSWAIWCDTPSDTTCAEATGLGVPIVALVQGTSAKIESELRRLAKWPAVVVASIRVDEQAPAMGAVVAGDEIAAKWHAVAPNIVLASRHAPGEPWIVPSWAQLVLVEDADRAMVERLMATVRGNKRPLFIVARRPKESEIGAPSPERSLCALDQLEREFSQQADIAGYLA